MKTISVLEYSLESALRRAKILLARQNNNIYSLTLRTVRISPSNDRDLYVFDCISLSGQDLMKEGIE